MRQTHQRPSRLRNGRGVEPAVRPGGGCAGSGWWRTGMGSLAAPEKGVLPPVGNTGVEPGPEVSWLLGTLRSEDPAKEGRRVWSEVLRPLLGGEWRQSGAKHYGKGFRLDDWSAGVYWDGQGDAKGTAMVEVRQSALDGLTKSARLDLLRLVRPRRLDLACDDGYQRCRPRPVPRGARGPESVAQRPLAARDDGVRCAHHAIRRIAVQRSHAAGVRQASAGRAARARAQSRACGAGRESPAGGVVSLVGLLRGLPAGGRIPVRRRMVSLPRGRPDALGATVDGVLLCAGDRCQWHRWRSVSGAPALAHDGARTRLRERTRDPRRQAMSAAAP